MKQSQPVKLLNVITRSYIDFHIKWDCDYLRSFDDSPIGYNKLSGISNWPKMAHVSLKCIFVENTCT